MKHEIIKGSEKDFEQAPEWAMQVDKCIETGYLFYTENIMGSQSGTDKCKWSDESEVRPLNFYANCEDEGFETIAQRRPITEPELEIEYVKYNGVDSINQPITEPVWDGEWLPPVGVECEFATIANYRENFVRAKVIAYGKTSVFMQHWASENEFIQSLDKIKFRPIRSPEDVARDEAKGIIAELCRSSASNGHSADLIYDAIAAGKITGITLSGK